MTTAPSDTENLETLTAPDPNSGDGIGLQRRRNILAPANDEPIVVLLERAGNKKPVRDVLMEFRSAIKYADSGWRYSQWEKNQPGYDKLAKNWRHNRLRQQRVFDAYDAYKKKRGPRKAVRLATAQFDKPFNGKYKRSPELSLPSTTWENAIGNALIDVLENVLGRGLRFSRSRAADRWHGIDLDLLAALFEAARLLSGWRDSTRNAAGQVAPRLALRGGLRDATCNWFAYRLRVRRDRMPHKARKRQ
jgi:hypothetical protein